MEHNPFLGSTSPHYGLWHELLWGEAGGTLEVRAAAGIQGGGE